MSKRTPFFIHVGFHKTATTWFQNQFFSRHPHIQYLGKAYPDHPSHRMRELTQTIVSEPDTTYRASDLRNELMDILEAHPINGYRTHGISYEGLSAGDDWFGGQNFYVADRLRKVFKDFRIKIIIGIREQCSMIESMYSEYVKLGGSKPLKRLLFSPYSEADDLLEKIKYASFIDYYRETFGPENVKVYLFERFRDSKRKVLNELCEFLGVAQIDLSQETFRTKSQVRLSRFGLKTMRFANCFFFKPLHNLSPVTLASYLTSKLLRKVEYNTESLKKVVKRNHEAALRYEQDRRIQNQIRHYLKNVIEGVDNQFFQGRKAYRYKLAESVKDYLKDFYRESNRKLTNLVKPDLSDYHYSLPSHKKALEEPRHRSTESD